MPLFDVILPTHRRPHTVGYAIASVLEQTVSDFTLHVVGDGCDSRTEDVVGSLADPRIRFRRFAKAPGFGYPNRNVVLRETSAPYVAYMTDDDLLFPDHLELGLRALEGRDLSLVAFASAQVRYPDDLDLHFFAFDWRLGPFSRFLNRWFIGSANLVHRRSLFDRIGYWDEVLLRFGDRQFYQRAWDSDEPAAFLPETTLLRFFAAQWESRYADLAVPPQARYLELLRRPGGVEDLRRRAAEPARTPGARVRQVGDFLRFALRSGPRFLRYSAGLLRANSIEPSD